MQLTKSFSILLIALSFSQNLLAQCLDYSQMVVYTSASSHSMYSTLREEQGFSVSGNVEEGDETDYVVYQFSDELSIVNSIKISSDLSDEGDPVIHERLSNGNYVLAGYSRINNARFLKIVCFNESEVLWQKELEGNLEIARALQALDTGGVLLVGSSNTDTNGASDAFAIEFDQDGNVLWKRGFGSSDNEHFYAAEISFDGLCLAGGNNKTYTGTHRPVLATLDGMGNLVDYNLYTGSGLSIFSTITKHDDTYFVGGYVSQGGSIRGIIVSLDLNFDVLWSKRVNIDGSADNVVSGIGVDDNGFLFVSAHREGASPKLFYLRVDPANGDLISSVTTNPEIPLNEVVRVGGYQAVSAESGMVSVSNTMEAGDFIIIKANECLSNSSCLEDADVSFENYSLTRISISPGERILQEVFDVNQFEVSVTAAPQAEPCEPICQGALSVEDFTVCVGEEINLTYQSDIDPMNVSSLLWFFGDDESTEVEFPSVFYEEAGSFEYSLELLTTDGCEYFAAGNIEVINILELPDFESPVILCEGESFEMDASDYPDWLVVDTDDNPISLFTTQTSGVYTFNFVSDCVQEIVEVEVLNVDLEVFDFNDVMVCTDEVVTLSVDDFESQFPNANLLIDDGMGSIGTFTGVFSNSYQQPGVYDIFLSGTIQGCSVNEGVEVAVDEPVTSFLDDSYEFCLNESLELDFSDFDFTVLNEEGNSIDNINIYEPGLYVFTGQNSCSELIQEIEVTTFDFSPKPLPLFQNLCPLRDTVAIGFTSDDYIYEWTNGSSDSFLAVSQGGTYEISVTDSTGQCMESYVFQVSETPYNPADIFVYPQIEICLEGQNSFSFPVEYAPYTFTDGTEMPLNYEATQSEVLNFSYSDGCYTYTDSLFILVESCLCPVWVPNAFTPDEDGLNDFFKPELECEVYDYQMIIFNRWGKEIFKSSDINMPWRGQSPNTDYYTMDGVYVYHIVFNQQLDGLKVPVELQGMVTLVR